MDCSLKNETWRASMTGYGDDFGFFPSCQGRIPFSVHLLSSKAGCNGTCGVAGYRGRAQAPYDEAAPGYTKNLRTYMHIFIPVGESLIEQLNLSPEDLVPFKLEYEVLRPGELFTEICEVPQEDMAES